MSSTNTWTVTGMTCGHCVASVTEEVGALEGVGDVAVEVVEGGASLVTVTGARDLTDEEVAAALEEAGGYALVGRD